VADVKQRLIVRFARIGHRGRSGPVVRTNAEVERDLVNGHA